MNHSKGLSDFLNSGKLLNKSTDSKIKGHNDYNRSYQFSNPNPQPNRHESNYIKLIDSDEWQDFPQRAQNKFKSSYSKPHSITQSIHSRYDYEPYDIINITQSMRNEALTSVQQLSNKVRNQLTWVNTQVDSFERNIKKMIEVEHKKLRQTLENRIQQIFEGHSEMIRSIYKDEAEDMSSNIISLQNKLSKLLKELDVFWGGLNSREWKDYTIEFLQKQAKMEDYTKKLLDQVKSSDIEERFPRFFTQSICEVYQQPFSIMESFKKADLKPRRK